MNIVDRRLNPKGKSLANRQRFIRRAQGAGEEGGARGDAKRSERSATPRSAARSSIPPRASHEPTFRQRARAAARSSCCPATRIMSSGDRIERPRGGGGGGGPAARPADGDGEEDAFRFVLTQEEFLDLFLDDLELPDLRQAATSPRPRASRLRRAGYHHRPASPANLDAATARCATRLARRIALKRPKPDELEALRRSEIADADERRESAERRAARAPSSSATARRTRRIPYHRSGRRALQPLRAGAAAGRRRR